MSQNIKNGNLVNLRKALMCFQCAQPITTSRTNLSNWTGQPTTSGALTTAQSGTVVGSF